MSSLDVVGIGNAIVDILATTDDGFLESEGLVKGSMTLIDEARGQALYERMGPAVECSGGSAANTMAGFAALGGKGAFIGKVRADQLGQVFAHDMHATGIDFTTAAAADGPATARCLVMVTPDAQRTMATYLGACVELGPDDLDREALARAKIVYLEGYLWDPPRAKAAMLEAARIVRAAGGKVALSLSDAFCVERHRKEFRDLIDNHVDILFANETEAQALTQSATFAGAVANLRKRVPLAAVTRSAAGSVVIEGEQTYEIPVEPVGAVVDTTGAGDLYAAGFLSGWVRGLGASAAGRLGSLAAGEVISHLGARPATDLSRLVAERLPAYA
jgi:sugar/nucleoside kinase (ribokinase family)